MKQTIKTFKHTMSSFAGALLILVMFILFINPGISRGDGFNEAKVRIESVDFKALKKRARVRIKTKGRADYQVFKSMDSKVITLEFRGAHIPEELSRVLDASGLGTPVSSVASFQVADNRSDVVRVVIRLKDAAEHSVVREGDFLYVDFPISKVDKAEAGGGSKKPSHEQSTDTSKAGRKKYKGQKIWINIEDADIRDVLRKLIPEQVKDLNIIFDEDVKGRVSMRLSGIPWDQAFDIILKSKGLGRVKEGNVIMVAPLSKIKKEKEELLLSKKAKEKLAPLKIKLIPVNYTKAIDLEAKIKNLLSERGSVSTDERTNTLIIRDVGLNLEEAAKLVKRLDSRTPQVLIEARIVEAQRSFVRDLGIQWGADYQTGGNVQTTLFGSTETVGQGPPVPNTGSASTSTTSTTGDASLFSRRSGVSNFAVNIPASGSAGVMGGLGFVVGKIGVNPLILDLRLTAGELDGLTRTIARPRITTLDNKEARIEQGESVPFETTSATGTTTQFVDANLNLTVTPHITPDGSVSMKIKASRNSIGSFRSQSGAPSINKKEAQTEVLVRDGETTVIGGIVVSDKSDTDSGIPFLKDIPALGWLFKGESRTNSQTELLIFITPRIVKQGGKD